MEKTISIPVPEGKKAEWVNGVLTLIDEKPKNIMERIKTLDDACAELGERHQFVMEYYEIEDIMGTASPDLIAYLKLRIICAALNEGWTPQFVEDELRYYPWYYLYTQAEIDRMDEDERAKGWLWGGSSSDGSSCGLGCSASNHVWSDSCSNISARLAFRTSELAKYAGEQFKEIYADFMLIRSPAGYVIDIKSDAPENQK